MASSFSDSSWEITEADRDKYQGIFQKNDPNGTGRLTSQEFRPLFLQSKLSPEELFAIWTLVDPSQSGSLDIGQFSAAMHLIFGRLAGKPIPSQLPPGLIIAPATPQVSEETQIKIQLLEREIAEKKHLLSQTSSADYQAETQKLKEKINLLYTKAPIHHPDFF
ncbi:actin organization and endocytosis protein [Entomophthora muscae]|uniref:Actin organization and endocytosis protein n=1 Tax=Entomophthora muscae TaxID=34485 RepID=A0ACC2RU38_9FUNG|nr:actin organization and endocytosis protein [Entomophthora muscae]